MDFSTRLMGHVAVMSYKYCQLDIKAEASSLIEVEVFNSADGDYSHIEDLAYIMIPEEEDRKDQIEVYPKNQEDLSVILKALFEQHPLVKYTIPEITNPEAPAEQPPLHYILMTMPEMTKERKDVVEDAVKVLHEECKLRIEQAYVQEVASLRKDLTPEEILQMEQEFKSIDETKENHLAMAEQLTDLVQKDIDEAYQKYLKNHEGEASSSVSGGFEENVKDTAQSVTF